MRHGDTFTKLRTGANNGAGFQSSRVWFQLYTIKRCATFNENIMLSWNQSALAFATETKDPKPEADEPSNVAMGMVQTNTIVRSCFSLHIIGLVLLVAKACCRGHLRRVLQRWHQEYVPKGRTPLKYCNVAAICQRISSRPRVYYIPACAFSACAQLLEKRVVAFDSHPWLRHWSSDCFDLWLQHLRCKSWIHWSLSTRLELDLRVGRSSTAGGFWISTWCCTAVEIARFNASICSGFPRQLFIPTMSR